MGNSPQETIDPDQDLFDSTRTLEEITAEVTAHFQRIKDGTESFNPGTLAVLIGHMGLHMILLTGKVAELRTQMRGLTKG